MDFIKHLEKLAKKNCAVVGIGAGNTFEARKIIEKSIKTVTKLGYAKAKSFSTPSELISALKAGEIACAVRGTLPAKETLSELKHVLKSSSIYRAALMCIENKHYFFLAPVGIDEGIFVDERFQFIKLIDSLLQRFSVTSKTAIISGGRPEDLGRSAIVDESILAGEKLVRLAEGAGLDVKHYGVQIENAYLNSNIIIAPNGIVGNLMFRTLHFIGNCRSYGAPVLNSDKTFIDTSRGKSDYSDSIMLASALSS